jgi:hypothetical protein
MRMSLIGYDGCDHRVHPRRLDKQTSHQARIVTLLTGRPTLGNSRLCHNAQADLLRKQQVRSSNVRVGSDPLSRSESLVRAATLAASDCDNA